MNFFALLMSACFVMMAVYAFHFVKNIRLRNKKDHGLAPIGWIDKYLTPLCSLFLIVRPFTGLEVDLWSYIIYGAWIFAFAFGALIFSRQNRHLKSME